MLRVDVDTHEVDRFVNVLITQLPSVMRESVDSAIMSIAVSMESVLSQAIRTQMENEEIGNFMAERTQVDVQPYSDGISIVISGKPEGETSDSTHSSGRERQADPDVNLWNLHEFGGVSPATTKPIYFEGPQDKQMVYSPHGRKESKIYKHKGEIRRIVAGLAIQLEAALETALTISGVSAVGATMKAGGVRVDMSSLVRDALSSSGFTEQALSGMGITRVVHKSGGQVVYLARNRGGTSTFFSARSAGLPTRL